MTMNLIRIELLNVLNREHEMSETYLSTGQTPVCHFAVFTPFIHFQRIFIYIYIYIHNLDIHY
jgi:hypothetical protein